LLSKYFKNIALYLLDFANFIHHPSLTLIKPFQAQLKIKPLVTSTNHINKNDMTQAI